MIFFSPVLWFGVRHFFRNAIYTYITNHIAYKTVIAENADFAKMPVTFFARGLGIYFLDK